MLSDGHMALVRKLLPASSEEQQRALLDVLGKCLLGGVRVPNPVGTVIETRALRVDVFGGGDLLPRPAPIVLPEEDPATAAAYEAAFSAEDVRDDDDEVSFHPLHLAGAEALRREEDALDF